MKGSTFETNFLKVIGRGLSGGGLTHPQRDEGITTVDYSMGSVSFLNGP